MKQPKYTIEDPIDNNRWQYMITWEIVGNDITKEEVIQIQSHLQELCAKEHILIEKFKANEQFIEMKLTASHQLNITKWNQTMQKKTETYLKGKVLSGSNHGKLWKEESRIISQSNRPAREDLRLMKMIESIREVDYYDLDEGMVDEDVEKLRAYLKERRLGILEQGNQMFLVDQKAMAHLINLNCFECTKRHQYGCCCGSPCAMSEKNMDLLDRHLLQMEEALRDLDEKQYQTLVEKGGFVAANGEIKAFDGHCAFLIHHEGIYKCMAHKYALDSSIPIYDICPLSCLMYPLEILECRLDKRKSITLLTAAVEEEFAENLSRWGSYKSLEVELRCIEEKAHDLGFKKADYQPVYKVNEGLLSHEFGTFLVSAIKELCN